MNKTYLLPYFANNLYLLYILLVFSLFVFLNANYAISIDVNGEYKYF